ncbi:MAG: peptidoglycan DD-metalloendopeptidase family protein, partial [Nostocoides sp.]
MKKALWVLAPLLAVLFVIPLGAAVTLAAVITPAAAEQTRLDGCGTAVAASGSWRPPFQQAYVRTSAFGTRFHPIHHVWRLHAGTDLVSQPRPGPVVAVAAGTVVEAAYRGGYGNAVDVDHGGGITSRYA